ncbi:MAG TPA: tetratricopeptide repeat protein [Vicinamibacteria bacterium]|nr:tetratricopeptide repeat protein [Vicinamibacteria bacterium]
MPSGPANCWQLAMVAGACLSVPSCDRIAALKDQFSGTSALEGQTPQIVAIRELYESGECDEALERIAHVTQADPDLADAFYYKGLCHLTRAAASSASILPLSEEEQASLEAFRRALAVNPRHALASVGIGDVYARHVADRPRRQTREDATDPYVLANAAYEKAVSIDPKLPQAQNRYGLFLERTGQLAEAERAYKAAAEAAATVPELAPDHYLAYGRFLAGAGGRLEDALVQYELAHMYREDDPTIRQEMAIVHSRLGLRHLERQEYLLAEESLTKAEAMFADRSAPEARKTTEALAELRTIRRR